MSGGHTPGYRVTADGRVFSTGHNWRGLGERELSQLPHKDGYLSVRVTVDGKRKRHAVHRLVAAQFLPARPSPAHQVRHLDGNKLNNCATNLAWGTAKQNAEDRDLHGTTYRGDRHHSTIARKEREAAHV